MNTQTIDSTNYRRVAFESVFCVNCRMPAAPLVDGNCEHCRKREPRKVKRSFWDAVKGMFRGK